MPRPAVKDKGFGADTPTALLDVADPRSFHGWYDVQCQGVLNDYCRMVGDKGGFFSCALAGGNPTGGKNQNGSPEYTLRAEYSPVDFTAQRIHKKCFNAGPRVLQRQLGVGVQKQPTRRRRRRRPQPPRQLTKSNSGAIAPRSQTVVDTNPPPMDASKKTIAVLLPMTSREMRLKELKLTPLNRIVIRSMADTLKADRTKFNVVVYAGFDDVDEFWSKIGRSFSGDITIDGFRVKFVECECASMVCNTNCIARKAYHDGVEYFFRSNDDTEFKTTDWITTYISALDRFNPPRLGVVGPTCKQGNNKIMTHDFTHRTHLEIFDMNYYPPILKNFFCDDWISNVYGGTRTKQLKEVEVWHHVRKTRYKANVEHRKDLPRFYREGKVKIESYIKGK